MIMYAYKDMMTGMITPDENIALFGDMLLPKKHKKQGDIIHYSPEGVQWLRKLPRAAHTRELTSDVFGTPNMGMSSLDLSNK